MSTLASDSIVVRAVFLSFCCPVSSRGISLFKQLQESFGPRQSSLDFDVYIFGRFVFVVARVDLLLTRIAYEIGKGIVLLHVDETVELVMRADIMKGDTH